MPSDLPAPFGALLIGTWVNIGLFTLELGQVRYLFKHYKDPFFIRAAVIAALAVDTLCTGVCCACVYLYTISNWGNLPYLARQYWPVPIYVGTTGGTALIVQMFLIYRVWVLSSNRSIALVLGLMTATAWISSLLSAIWLVRFPEYIQRFHLLVPATLWFGSSAVSDVAIAVVLVWYLQTIKSGFISTQSLVRRLMANSLKSGAATAGIALIVISLYLQDNQSVYATGVCFNMGRVYSLTMLYNLNTRKRGRHTGDSHGNTTSDVRQGPINLSAIQISRSVHVDEDASQSGLMRKNEAVTQVDGKSSNEEYYIRDKAAPFASA